MNDGGETWAVKKRKRGREKENLVGVKLRKSSSVASPSTTEKVDPIAKEKPVDPAPTPKAAGNKATQPPPSKISEAVTEAVESPTPTAAKSPPTTAGLGLVGYSSDED